MAETGDGKASGKASGEFCGSGAEGDAVFVKICGTTSLEDARVAAGAGADAVGFVFAAESRRRVTAAEVTGISAAMAEEFPAVERVGVFTTADAGAIVAEARAARLTAVQLHGGGGVGLARAVREMAPELGVTAVVSWEMGAADAGERVAAEMLALGAAGVRRVLLDSKVGAELGGTGVAFRWAEAAQVLVEVRAGMEVMVAGGLRPETVAEAVRVLQPWGVDAVSGVEATAGRKDPEKVRGFVRAARG